MVLITKSISQITTDRISVQTITRIADCWSLLQSGQVHANRSRITHVAIVPRSQVSSVSDERTQHALGADSAGLFRSGCRPCPDCARRTPRRGRARPAGASNRPNIVLTGLRERYADCATCSDRMCASSVSLASSSQIPRASASSATIGPRASLSMSRSPIDKPTV